MHCCTLHNLFLLFKQKLTYSTKNYLWNASRAVGSPEIVELQKDMKLLLCSSSFINTIEILSSPTLTRITHYEPKLTSFTGSSINTKLLVWNIYRVSELKYFVLVHIYTTRYIMRSSLVTLILDRRWTILDLPLILYIKFERQGVRFAPFCNSTV